MRISTLLLAAFQEGYSLDDIYNRGSHTFSIPASIIREVIRGSLPLGAHIWRSSHSPRISRSRSLPLTLENWASRSFLGEFFILRLTEFTLYVANSHCVGFLLRVLRRHCLPTQYKLVNPFSSFHSPVFILHASHSKTGCHTSSMRRDSPLAPFFSPHFLILGEIWLPREGVTTPNMDETSFFYATTSESGIARQVCAGRKQLKVQPTLALIVNAF